MRSRSYRRVACLVTLVAGLGAVGLGGVAGADVGANVTTTPIIIPSNAENTAILQNDEPIAFDVPPGDLDDLSNVHVIECSDPGGNITSSYLSTLTAGSCDALTEVSFVTSSSGSLTTPDPTDPTDAPGSVVAGNGAVVIYALPNAPDLFEKSSAATCDLTDYCIFYIGPDADHPSDGSGVVYSTPFEVDQTYDYLGGSPAPPPGATETVPGVPTAVTATAENGQVAVGWTPPSSDGDSAITEYIVTPYLEGVAQAPYEALPTAVSDTVINLTPGDSYSFTVEAVNSVGASTPASSPPAVPLAVASPTTTTTLPYVATSQAPSSATATTIPAASATTTTTTTTTTSITTTTTTTLARTSSATVPTTTVAPIAISAYGTSDVRGRLSTQITCGAQTCTGMVQLYGSAPTASTRRVKRGSKKLTPAGTVPKPVSVLLGSAKYQVAADTTAGVRLTLTHNGELWLATSSKHGAKAQLELKPSHGKSVMLEIVVY